MLPTLEVRLCKPAIYKLKVLGRGDLIIINQWGNHKKGGTKFLKFSGRKQKRGDTIFDLTSVGEETLAETMI